MHAADFLSTITAYTAGGNYAQLISLESFFRLTADGPLSGFHPAFRSALQRGFYSNPHGLLPHWVTSLRALPDIRSAQLDCSTGSVSINGGEPLPRLEMEILVNHLRLLRPWRKGPWQLLDIRIDAEWQSNLKWDRIKNHIAPLEHRLVLDVGSGNGYYLYRMLEHSPRLVIGIEPSQQHLVQFQTFARYAPALPAVVLPLSDADLPSNMEAFDTVFSMGVIYHRREPARHLDLLRECLRPGGQLVLESLVVEGDDRTVFRPPGRYAGMRNVYEIPSDSCLAARLESAGFADIRLCDRTATTVNEQRRTEWMQYQSLADFLDPDDHSRTIEGYPAPARAVFTCARK